MRKALPKIKEFHDFLPREFDSILEKMRKDSRDRLEELVPDVRRIIRRQK